IAVGGNRWDKAGKKDRGERAKQQQQRPNDEWRFRIYDARTYGRVAQIEGLAGAVRAISFSHDNQRLITGADDGTLRVWEVPTGKLINMIGKKGDSAVNCVIQSPDGGYVVAGSTDGTVTACNPSDGHVLFRARVHGAAVTCLGFTPDGSRL